MLFLCTHVSVRFIWVVCNRSLFIFILMCSAPLNKSTTICRYLSFSSLEDDYEWSFYDYSWRRPSQNIYNHFSFHLQPRSRTAMSWGRHIFTYIRNCITVLQAGCAIRHSHQQWMRILVAPHTHQQLIILLVLDS